jgi:hypothetical protein
MAIFKTTSGWGRLGQRKTNAAAYVAATPTEKYLERVLKRSFPCILAASGSIRKKQKLYRMLSNSHA